MLPLAPGVPGVSGVLPLVSGVPGVPGVSGVLPLAPGVPGVSGVLPLVPDMYSFHTFPSQAAIAFDQVKLCIIPGHKLMKIWRDVPEMYENQPLISLIVGAVTPRRWVTPRRQAAPPLGCAAGWRRAASSRRRFAAMPPLLPFLDEVVCALSLAEGEGYNTKPWTNSYISQSTY